MNMRKLQGDGVGLLVAAMLCGCGGPGLIVGAGATAGEAAVEERGFAAAATDTRISIDVNGALLHKDQTLFADTLIDVVEGRVLLTGILATDSDKAEAERLAWTVAGVKEVINEIQVGRSRNVADYGRDKRIGTELRAQMIGDGKISDINYITETINAVIYLCGIAKDQAELDRVMQHARTIAGVRRVVSYVVLKDDPRRKKS
jgi:osmotically-inducible protein OsmY